jgi:hypothetical protein
MDAFFNFMTGDTTVLDVTVHNWVIALGAFAILWGAILLKDL